MVGSAARWYEHPTSRRMPQPAARSATRLRAACVVVRMLRGGEDGAASQGRWIRGTPVREPQ